MNLTTDTTSSPNPLPLPLPYPSLVSFAIRMKQQIIMKCRLLQNVCAGFVGFASRYKIAAFINNQGPKLQCFLKGKDNLSQVLIF